MAIRAARIWSTFAFLALLLVLPWSSPALAVDARSIATTENSDYFGFDLRSQQNVSLDQCKSTCLGDSACRAFTYNVKAKWCFLKSDFSQLKPFAGAVAGKVVLRDSAPDIGAPPALSFFAAGMVDEARRFRSDLTDGSVAVGEEGLAALTEAGKEAMRNGDPRTAMQKFTSAVATTPDDGALWIELARAILGTPPVNDEETAKLKRDATSAAWNGYQLSRSAMARAEALAVLAVGLDKRELYRPALKAYEASLALNDSASVRTDYEDLKARKGFRIVDHSVDNDSTSPRICAQFSEELVKTGVDYTTFVKLDDAAPKAIEAKDRQICVEGLEHGRHYSVTFRAGLPAAVGEALAAPVTLSIYVQDRSPSVRFTGDSFVLPATARRGIPLVTVNTATADLELFRVGDRSLAQLLSGYQFLRQLDGYDISSISEQMGEPIWDGEIDIPGNDLNKEVTTSFPIDEALPDRKPGVYVLTARPQDDRSEDYQPKATQWFVVSDIGLSTYTGQDGLNVFARSLGTALPLAGVELTLLARNNEILGKATTGAEGRATFTPGLTRGTGGMVPAVLMASQGDSDFVFLDMTRAGFDLSDRGVTGRASPGALDVYAWTERGIYRVGEEVHVAALARDDAARAVENLPLTFVFSRPDGVEDRRIISDGGKAGGHAVDLTLPANAMRGTWSVAIHTDPKQPAVATQNFLVEDFVPDRIEFDLTSDHGEIAAGEAASVTVDGRFLYGAPAAGLALEGELTVSTRREWDRFKGFSFGLADEQEGEATQVPLAELPPVGEDGKATFPVAVDQAPSTTRLLNAAVTVRMRESGGRAVERALDIAIRPQGDMIGIRPEFSGNEVPQGSTAKFSLIAASAQGERMALHGAHWSLVKIERNYQWYRSGNSWNYEPVTFTRAIASGQLDLAADSEATVTVPVDWGRYRLEVETADPTGPMTSYEFNAGWFVEATSTETPDGLEIALDKDAYAAGETAKLQVSPRFAGELLVTVGADRLLKTFTASVPEGGATVDIPVDGDWGAGAYVTATLYRPGNAQGSRMPARAIGVKWLAVTPGEKQLGVTLSPPEKSEPRRSLSIPVEVTGASAASEAYVMVAAVDVGILNLTRYQAPDPEGWFFGQRQLGLELRDLYGRLIDGSLGITGKLRTGGDGGNMVTEGSPPTEKLVAFSSGPVQLDGEGKATVEFDLPQFNGTVRVMAVAWTKEAMGHASTDVIVRDPVVITASLPRFLTPGDQATMRLDIANTDAPDGDYVLSIEPSSNLATEAGSAPGKVTLTAGKRQSLTVPITAQATGEAGLTIRLANDSGVSVEQNLSLPVRRAELPVTTRTVVDLAANGGSLRIDRELLAASLLDGAYVSVGVSYASAFDVPSLLMTLDRYPYGCAEQTTSRALPLLYLSELAQSAGMADDPDLRRRIQEAVYHVLNNQSSSGSFGLWGPGSGDLWLDAYVTDFLTRAREKNYDVPREAMLLALDNLQNSLSYDLDLRDRGSDIAYALYVLARNKKASIGDLRYYSDTQLDAFSSPMAVAQLAASLALYGDQPRSEAAFRSALTLAKATEHDYARSDYGSRLRDGAAMLALAAESRPAPKVVPELVGLVTTERKAASYLSTQDQAWMLLAARALRANNDAIQLTVNGTPHGGAYSERIDGSALVDNPLVIANTGSDPVQAVVTAVAAPAQALPAGGDGFEIERTYYTLDGSEANVTSVKQNERFVVVLKVDQSNDWPSRVLVTDLLPAGFEIDNPGLVSSADLGNFPWLDRTEAAHLEFRDDRFVAAFDRQAGDASQITLAYVVRAVTPGLYAHPAASVEDMYRPQYSARTSTGMMEVAAP
ncbi:alpha-2-macroglobulin family protein [Mesorhizobium sp. KR1-2]|uniref:alpha-2-macroglobulin family protein n=1 Tax=Mesorhizobium sp. KR1-2 TaxID=3156609 RepID=UPI0032B553F2